MMSDGPPDTRSQEHGIEIDAPVEAVWTALTDAEEMTRWYVQDAEVEPGEGGRVRVSWGEGMVGESRIEIWEPGERLRLVHQPPSGEDAASAEMPDMPGPIVEDYLLEGEGGVTRLRLVTSGIPATSEWDAFYDGTNQGWEFFFRTLRHYLERHRGQPREHTVVMQPVGSSADETWATVTGPNGLALHGPLNREAEGSSYSTTTGWGDPICGVILMAWPPTALSLTLENLDDSILALAVEQAGGSPYLYVSLSSYGDPGPEVLDLHRRWREWFETELAS